MIKIMNVISDTNIGGAGRVLINYMKYYDKSRFHVSVALPHGSKLAQPLIDLGAQVHYVDGIADKSLDITGIRELKKLIRREKPDIVHTHGAMSGRIAGRRCGTLVIYTRHSAFPVKSWMKKGPGRLANKLINEYYSDRIIAVSPAAAENLTDAGISSKHIEVMMNGVEPVLRASEEDCAALREKLGITKDDFVCGILARIEDYKGHEDILHAMRMLKDRGLRMKLLVGGEGTYQEQVQRTTAELGLEDDVIFMGFVTDVGPVLSVMDVQLNASWGTETSSLSILEGFSMGLCAVISDYGGNPQLVTDGENGYLFPTRNSAALADKLAVLMGDRKLLTEMNSGARRVYLSRFTGEIFAARLEEIYDSTIAKAK